MDKRSLLQQISFGARVAEDEGERLAAYFVETDQWKRVYDGEVDIVQGPKGSGKSAIYSLLLAREGELFDRNIIVVAAENPRGTTAFSGLVVDPPANESEFENLWKLYLLSLVADVLRDYGITNPDADFIINKLVQAQLMDPDAERKSLARRLRAVREYVRSLPSAASVEATLTVDPASGVAAFAGRIIFSEPTQTERESGYVSADELLRAANDALEAEQLSVWILLDRLDVAFADSRELEGNALRALFRVYVGLLGFEALRTKIFLRRDIWDRIFADGFREASHITRMTTITWGRIALLNLIIRRALNNDVAVEYYQCDRERVLSDVEEQEKVFHRLFPQQVEVGERKPDTLGWMLGRTRDGSGYTAPRELIHLLEAAREEQIHALELGRDEPSGEQIISATAIKDALPTVSESRLKQTLFAEYPEFKAALNGLENQKAEQTAETLAAIWKVDVEKAARRAQGLVEIGFFEERRDQGTYWVPFLYRSALQLVQGRAEGAV